MNFAQLSVSFSGNVMRFGMAIVFAVALALPHFSTTAPVSGFPQVMDHMSEGYGDMSQMLGHHGKANGSLCATICAGVDRFSGSDLPLQRFIIIPAFWTTTSDPQWTLYSPDPALRPPDPAFTA